MKKLGRPLNPPANGKVVTVSMRMRGELRDKLVVDAKASGRNLSQECLWRIETSLIREMAARIENLEALLLASSRTH